MIEVRNNPERSRFELFADGEAAGYLRYRLDDGWTVLEHTSIDEAFAGRSLGSALAAGALDLVREGQGSVVVECPFIKRWLTKHPEYDDLLA